MKVYYLLVSVFCVWTPAHCQFFYSSHYSPLTQISPFFPQPFLQPLPAVSPLAYTIPASQPATVTYNIPRAPAAEFRGFGYRTEYKDGGSATVYYVTGPEAENLRSLKDFSNLGGRIQETEPEKARSLASDITDINAIPDAQTKIQSILQPAEFQKLFDGVNSGVVNFYSFPAGTAPLVLARSSFGNGTDNENATVTTTPASEEAEPAESVVNSKVVTNDVDDVIKSNETTPSTEATSETKAAESTTLPTETTSVEEKSEETTVESTTKV